MHAFMGRVLSTRGKGTDNVVSRPQTKNPSPALRGVGCVPPSAAEQAAEQQRRRSRREEDWLLDDDSLGAATFDEPSAVLPYANKSDIPTSAGCKALTY